jgi:hypothetical protein
MEVGLAADDLDKPFYRSRSHTILTAYLCFRFNSGMNYACEDRMDVDA